MLFRSAPCGRRPGGRQSWPAPRAKARGVGSGRAKHPLPPPATLGPNLEGMWRGGRAEEGHRIRRHPEWGPGRGWRRGEAGGKVERSRLSHPTPLCTPPLTFSHGSSSPTSGKATGPTARPGCAAFQRSFSPFLPIPRRKAQEPGGEGRGEVPGPLSEPTTLMILPQVHLRKPCYDFYFL